MENRDIPSNEKISAMTSPKSFFPMGQAECEFCGKVRDELPKLPFVRWHLFEPCKCPGAVNQRDAREKEMQRIEQEKLDEKKRRNVVRLFEEIPSHFRDRTFEAYRVTPENKEAYDLARAYPATEGKQSILFAGTPGTGKTHLAAAIAIEQVNQQKAVIFGTVPTILGRIKSTFSGEGATETEVKNAIMGCSLLVLDDLGKEKPSEWVEETLYEIINARYVRKLPVIITTNVGLSAVERRYPWNGEAIVSRLFEMCAGVQLVGKDFRRSRP
jgi:DNA replication protein DnaC